MIDILVLLETIAPLEEVGVIDHLDKALLKQVERVNQSLKQKLVRHGMIARGHDGEVNLVARRAQLPVDEWHEAQHDVIVVRTGMIDDLIIQGFNTAPKFSFGVGDDLLHYIEAQIRNFSTTRVILQVLQGQFVGITIEDFAEANDGMFGLLEGPRTVVEEGRVCFVEHELLCFFVTYG